MAAITLGNLITYDENDTEHLGEYGDPPDYDTPVQLFEDVEDVHGIAGYHSTQRENGNLVVFTNNGWFPVIEVDKDTGAVSELASDSDAWGDTADPVDIYRVQRGANNKLTIAYKENTTGDITAKRLTDAALIDELIVLEAAFADEVISAALSPSGQYLYLLVTADAAGDNWVATLYEYDLDNAGARTELKQYTMGRPANPSVGGGLALGCGKDGNLYVGYYSVDFVDSGTPGLTHARYTYLIDELDSAGTVLNTWQVHQYTNTAQFDPVGMPGGDTASNDGYGPLFTTSFADKLWGFFYRFSAFDSSTPGSVDTRVLEVDLANGNVTFHDWYSNDDFNGKFISLWPFEVEVFQGLERADADNVLVWGKYANF